MLFEVLFHTPELPIEFEAPHIQGMLFHFLFNTPELPIEVEAPHTTHVVSLSISHSGRCELRMTKPVWQYSSRHLR